MPYATFGFISNNVKQRLASFELLKYINIILNTSLTLPLWNLKQAWGDVVNSMIFFIP